jgi:glycogen debranching enzyme
MTVLKQRVKELNLWQYYVFDVAKEKASVKANLQYQKAELGEKHHWEEFGNVEGKTVVELASIVRSSGKIINDHAFSSRFCTTVDAYAASSLVKAAFTSLKDDREALSEAWGRIVDVLNVDLYKEWEDDEKVALENVRGRVKYTRLDENGPKRGKFTTQYARNSPCLVDEKHSRFAYRFPLVEPCFTRLPPSSTTSDPLVLAVANNGWIWDANPLQNFALPPSKSYLRREVIVWDDTVKLRYGSSPSDNPWLWNHMTTYVSSLASIFDGFRIDNCHSTPLHVGVYLLDKARVKNPNLYVCAELFTGNEEMDLEFVRRLGLNSLIREAFNGFDTKEMSRLLYRHGVGKPIGG